MKKKTLYLLIIYLFFGIVAGIGVLGYCAKKNKEEKKVLESLYYRQNTAFELCGNLNKRRSYHSANELRLNRIVVDLYVFNNIQSEYQVTVDDVIDYLSEEYDSSGKLKVYFVPQNIKEYIEWYLSGGDDTIWNFGKGFNKFLLSTNKDFYWDINYDETVDALEKYKNDPAYVPPGQNN